MYLNIFIKDYSLLYKDIILYNACENQIPLYIKVMVLIHSIINLSSRNNNTRVELWTINHEPTN